MLVAPRVFRAPEGPAAVLSVLWAGPLCVPVGGGPPARSPHASLRLGVVDLEARPGPAATHRHRGQAPPPPTDTAARPCASKPARALRSLRRPPHQWGWVADVVWRVVLTPGQARPPPTGTAAAPSGALHTGSNGGFALHEACWRCVAGVSDAHVVQFPPTRFTSSHGYRVWALSTRWPGCLKPPSPLLVCACGGLKLPSPLR